MIDNSQDKGYITVNVRKTENGHELCKMGFQNNPGEEPIYVDYENGMVFFVNGENKDIFGRYETAPGPNGCRIFDYPSNKVIGYVFAESIFFCKQDVDHNAGIHSPDWKCLAYTTNGGRIVAEDLLTSWGLINGSSIGAAAAFVALFYNYKINCIFRDYFKMNDADFQTKYASYFIW